MVSSLNVRAAARRPLVALVSATAASIPPAVQAFQQEFPEARTWNLLDDRLIVEAVEAGGLTDELVGRMSRLIHYALDAGADGVLLTCSIYGPVAHELAPGVEGPLYASDDAAFHDAASSGYSRIILLSSLPEALRDAQRRFTAFLRAWDAGPTVIGVLAGDAFAAAARGDVEAVVEALAAAVRAADLTADAILLAQYSLAPAADALARLLGLPVLAGPPRAAAKMRAVLLGSDS